MANNNLISSSSSGLLHHGWNEDSKWIDRITKGVQKPIPLDTCEIRPCIFKVPKSLSDMKPEAYFPQKIGLGPYNHFRRDLYYIMERRKFDSVQRLLAPVNQVLNSHHHLILKLTEYDDLVRAFYKECCLDLKEQVLAWVVVIDAFFLLDQLRINHCKMFRYSKFTELVKDIIMVENQIPLVLLWTIYRSVQPFYDELRTDNVVKDRGDFMHDVEMGLIQNDDEVQIEQGRSGNLLYDFERELQIGIRSRGFAAEQDVDNFLYETLLTFSKENSPFKLANLFPYLWYTKSNHLLDFMYNLIVCDDVPRRRMRGSKKRKGIRKEGHDDEQPDEEPNIDYLQVLGTVLGITRLQEIQNLINFVTNIPWKVIIGLIRKVYKSDDNKVKKIEIPSASKLCQIGGVKFELTKWHIDGGDRIGCIKDIRFNEKDRIFHLPLITLNSDAEVILRNLVAHEELLDTHQRPIWIVDYVHLMHGIVRNAEDVKVLKETKIVDSSLGDDKIVELFDGISKSMDNTSRESYLKETIDGVNNYFDNRPRVKAGRYTKKCLYTTWKLIVFVASVITIFQLIFKAFCGVYDCDNIFHHKQAASPADLGLFPAL